MNVLRIQETDSKIDQDLHALSESHFVFLPFEVALKIIKYAKSELPRVRNVCDHFKNVADHHITLKGEMRAIIRVIKKFCESREDRKEIREEIKKIIKERKFTELPLFKLLAKFELLLKEQSPERFAQFLPDENLMKKAPLFTRCFDKLCRRYWNNYAKEKASFNYSFIPITLPFNEYNFQVFLNELKKVSPDCGILIDLSLFDEQIDFLARALKSDKFNVKKIKVTGDQGLDLKNLEKLLNAIGQSSQVQELHLNECRMYGDEFSYLEESLSACTSLKVLALEDFAFNPQNLTSFINLLSQNSHIEKLTLGKSSFFEFKAILENLSYTHITQLVFRNSHFDDNEIIGYLMGKISTFDKLKLLDLDWNEMSQEAIKTLTTIHPGNLQLILPSI